jgi:hypothetical protein
MTMSETKEPIGDYEFTIVLRGGHQIYSGYPNVTRKEGMELFKGTMQSASSDVIQINDAFIDRSEIVAICDIAFQEKKENDNG